jgi:hypothetical protein
LYSDKAKSTSFSIITHCLGYKDETIYNFSDDELLKNPLKLTFENVNYDITIDLTRREAK